MRLFHETSYTIYNGKVKQDLKFVVLSDLHYSYCVTNEKLDRILNEVRNINPDYILFPGDIIDSVDMVKEYKEEKRFLSWLKKIGEIAPVLMSLGGHDFFTNNGSSIHEWAYGYDEKLYKKINKISNVFLLDNSFYEDKNIFVVGYTQSIEYYHPDHKPNIYKPMKEDKDLMLKELKELHKKISLNSKKIDILLVHSPVCINEPGIKEETKNYDYIISGHMHNGCVPPILYELWNSTRGLIAPNFQLFPKNERNTLRKKGDKLIVNGPLTMFHEHAGLFEKMNIIFPSYLSILNLTNDQNYDTNKIFVKMKYKK